MNTMLMSVFERTHEISVLLALGWTRRRIMRMILDEAAMLGLLGGIVGVALGVIGVKILGASPAIRGLLKPDLGIALLTLSVLIAVVSRNPQWTLSSLAKLATKSQSCLAERMRSAQFNRTMRNYSGHISSTVKLLFASFITVASLAVNSARTAEPGAATMSAAELAKQLDSVREGNALIRSKMEIQSPDTGRRTLQLQIKERRTKAATDLAYQVLWPNDHKGEAVILHQSQGVAKGSIIVPRQPVRSITGSQMNEGLFDSDLSYQDALENFFAWKKQAIVGSEVDQRSKLPDPRIEARQLRRLALCPGAQLD